MDRTMTIDAAGLRAGAKVASACAAAMEAAAAALDKATQLRSQAAALEQQAVALDEQAQAHASSSGCGLVPAPQHAGAVSANGAQPMAPLVEFPVPGQAS